MLRKLKSHLFYIGDEQQYFATIHGFALFDRIQQLVVVSSYAEKNPCEIVMWVHQLDLQTQNPKILTKLIIKAYQEKQAKYWKIQKVIKISQQKNIVLLNIYNQKINTTKIFFVELVTGNKQLKLTATDTLNGRLRIQQQQKIYAVHYNASPELKFIGQVKLQQLSTQNSQNRLTQTMYWVHKPFNLQNIPFFSQLYECDIYSGIIIDDQHIFASFHEESQPQQSQLVQLKRYKQQLVVVHMRKIQRNLLSIQKINDNTFGALRFQSEIGLFVQIVSKNNLQILSTIWTHAYQPSFSIYSLSFHSSGSFLLANQNMKMIVNMNAHKYWQLEKVGGLTKVQILPLNQQKYLVSCCHSIAIYQTFEQEQDEQFLAM